MLYECRFCEQGFVGNPGSSCPDCGADDEEFPRGYLRRRPTTPEMSHGSSSRDRGETPTM